MPSVRRLKSLADVRAALSWVWRKVEADEIDPAKGRLLVATGTAIAAVIRDESLERLEERLSALEAAQGKEPR